MVTDQQVRRLFKLVQTEKYFGTAAAKAGMDGKTARKYRRLGKLPSEIKKPPTWQTRKDPFGNRGRRGQKRISRICVDINDLRR
jgi:hypothetical protein